MAPLLLGALEAGAAPAKVEPRQALPVSKPGAREDFFFAERVLTLVGIVAVALWLRVQALQYSTAYMDESVYVLYGRMFLARHFEAPLDSPLRWSFGWYLWPIIAAAADRIGGIVAVRAVAATAGTITVLVVYGFVRRLYGIAVALGTAALFAVIAPAVMASRIATRDAGAIFFFALALWAFVRAWDTKEYWTWLASAACLFCAFLCKYLVAIYFPLLVVVALWKGWRPLFLFCAPLAVGCGLYLAAYWTDLKYLLLYGESYGSLRAPAWQAWDVYVFRRFDFWIIAFLALLGLLAQKRRISLLLWLGAAVGLLFQWRARADFDFWKHAVYSLIFLTPIAVHGIITAARHISDSHAKQMLSGIAAILVVAGAITLLGRSAQYDELVFWPNVEPVLAYFEGRLPNNARLLVDDSVFRYYFHPMLRQWQIVDPFYFRYGDDKGKRAYQKAVEDGWFDYIVLDAGMGNEASSMDAAIAGHMSRYKAVLQATDSALGHPIQIFERIDPAAAVLERRLPTVELAAPVSGAIVPKTTSILGQTTGAEPGSKVRLEIFSDRWYSLGKLPLRYNGTFGFPNAVFGGRGWQACNHMVRARLYDAAGNPRAVSVAFKIARAGSTCR
ncbi:MAG: ArnT family glycosyltransferase [Terriglobales bacterium]